jgi:hypothetical protein
VLPLLPLAIALIDYPGCAELGRSLIEHACFHGERGPFGDGVQPYPLVAAAPGDVGQATPNVNAVHTLFALTLPGAGPGLYEGGARYRPNRSGDWAILVTADPPVPAPPPNSPAPPVPAPPRPMVPVRVVSATGAAVPVELQHAVAGCSRLPQTAVFKLTAGQTYQIIVGPSASERVGLVFEKLADFEAPAFPDRDGDGHGDGATSMVTACRPPAGQVAADGDCDDKAATVFPGAPELCNGIDDDCDGTSDEGIAAGMCEADGGASLPDAGADLMPAPDVADVADVADAAAGALPPVDGGADTAGGPSGGPDDPGSDQGGGCSVGRRPRQSSAGWLLFGLSGLAGFLIRRSSRIGIRSRSRSASWCR